MNNMILRARQMSLALLVIAVVDHGHLQADYSGATPGSSGLMRLGRDLMRRAGGEIGTRIPSSARVAGPGEFSRIGFKNAACIFSVAGDTCLHKSSPYSASLGSVPL